MVQERYIEKFIHDADLQPYRSTGNEAFHANGVYFLEEEDIEECVHFLKLWKKMFLRHLNYSGRDRFLGEEWIEKDADDESPGSIALKLFVERLEESKFGHGC